MHLISFASLWTLNSGHKAVYDFKCQKTTSEMYVVPMTFILFADFADSADLAEFAVYDDSADLADSADTTLSIIFNLLKAPAFRKYR